MSEITSSTHPCSCRFHVAAGLTSAVIEITPAIFPSNKNAPRVVVTNGMMIPNYSKPDDWEKFNALGVTQYGQMTAGSYMYIGPQGIVHGTTITVLNACRKIDIRLVRRTAADV